jgi:hypothetical protein
LTTDLDVAGTNVSEDHNSIIAPSDFATYFIDAANWNCVCFRMRPRWIKGRPTRRRRTTRTRNRGRRARASISARTNGEPLTTKVYQDAERLPFASPGHPGIEITGDGKGCNQILGAFQIHELSIVGTTLKSLTATFEQSCEKTAPSLRGCVHFSQ